jgi:hypothetical protein
LEISHEPIYEIAHDPAEDCNAYVVESCDSEFGQYFSSTRWVVSRFHGKTITARHLGSFATLTDVEPNVSALACELIRRRGELTP